MSLFTPVTGGLGGSLIGLSASNLLLFNGDILGASGILSTTVLRNPVETLKDRSIHWKLVLLTSFCITTNLYTKGTNVPESLSPPAKSSFTGASTIAQAIAGFLVGFGTKLGNGCTTGHGICGLARLSKRSFVACGTFVATGILTTLTLTSPTALLADHTSFLRNATWVPPKLTSKPYVTYVISLVTAAALLFGKKTTTTSKSSSSGDDETEEEKSKQDNDGRKLIPAAISGALFSLGLMISDMVVPSKVYGFLDVGNISRGTYDPTLMTVLGSGVTVSWLSYQFVQGFNLIKNSKALTCPLAMKKPSGKFNVPTNKVIDWQLIGGAACFGIGWGTAFLCPGPAISQAALGVESVVYQWMPCFFIGSYLAQKVKNYAATKKV